MFGPFDVTVITHGGDAYLEKTMIIIVYHVINVAAAGLSLCVMSDADCLRITAQWDHS